MRLDIGNIYDWYKNPVPSSVSARIQYHILQHIFYLQVMPLAWYPRNFTNPEITGYDLIGTMQGQQNTYRLSDDQLYSVQLGLYVIGYKEAKDEEVCKSLNEWYNRCVVDSGEKVSPDLSRAVSPGDIFESKHIPISLVTAGGAHQSEPGGTMVSQRLGAQQRDLLLSLWIFQIGSNSTK